MFCMEIKSPINITINFNFDSSTTVSEQTSRIEEAVSALQSIIPLLKTNIDEAETKNTKKAEEETNTPMIFPLHDVAPSSNDAITKCMGTVAQKPPTFNEQEQTPTNTEPLKEATKEKEKDNLDFLDEVVEALHKGECDCIACQLSNISSTPFPKPKPIVQTAFLLSYLNREITVQEFYDFLFGKASPSQKINQLKEQIEAALMTQGLTDYEIEREMQDIQEIMQKLKINYFDKIGLNFIRSTSDLIEMGKVKLILKKAEPTSILFNSKNLFES